MMYLVGLVDEFYWVDILLNEDYDVLESYRMMYQELIQGNNFLYIVSEYNAEDLNSL